MISPLRHLLLHGLAACTAALVLLVMLSGVVAAHPHGMPENALSDAGEEIVADVGAADEGAPDGLAADCPHAPPHQHSASDCCLGPCCTWLAPVAPLGTSRIAPVLGGPDAVPPSRSAASGGQFRPPRQPAA